MSNLSFKKQIAVGLIFSVLVLSGCSSPNEFQTEEELYQDSVIPKSEHTMKEIYENRGSTGNQTEGQGMPTQYAGYMVNKRPASDYEVGLSPYTVSNTAQAHFHFLPNPVIYMYILPSLTKEDRLPRPGWVTEFHMYDKDEYALPGETSLREDN
ncbi:hypothetical protein HUO09_16915 [Vibrio sp. Y2-5]|uniref:hypothetical protein n=1 Tax=Vibrio sp. Y2-5 TaxID=2743977 RepID=UPI001660BFA6|nr:hypothetical protein [Vibrio sp. Y2-5]MBD0788037.1 hypothetical protein [Vibrio sp. Y2-5]